MELIDHLRSVHRTFTGHRVRAALTLLGIVIGTGSIVLLAGLLRGAEEALTKLNQGVSESDTLRIRSDEPPQHQLGKATRPLSQADGEALGASPALGDVSVATEAMREAVARLDGREKRVRLIGGRSASLELYRLAMAKGRFVDDEDLGRGARVAVIGHEVWTELLKEDPAPLGKQLTVDGQSWTIVGVLAHKPTMGHGTGTWMWDRRVVVPQSAFDAAFDPTHGVGSIFMRVGAGGGAGATTDARLAALGRVAERLLLRRHLGVKNFQADDRSGRNQEKLIITIIEILVIGTGLLSLLVGGINIMNIMLVTVTERTREIGIRRAIGASPGAILAQFVLEAGAVALAGGVLGVLGGAGLAWLLVQALAHAFGAWSFHLEPWSVGLGLALALATGVGFGWFPAWRASRLDPVEALRFE